MDRLRKLVIFALSLFIQASPSSADLQMNESGAVCYLKSNRFEPGDEQAFASFLDRPRAHPLRIVYLNSRGGRTQTAIAIGNIIRSHSMDTAFIADRDRCVSACTTVFLGGVHRYYIGGETISDGVATHKGLGFHPSGTARGEESISEYYKSMGVPGATSLRYRVYSQDAPAHQPLFFAGGRSALNAGVATSLSQPEDKALRY